MKKAKAKKISNSKSKASMKKEWQWADTSTARAEYEIRGTALVMVAAFVHPRFGRAGARRFLKEVIMPRLELRSKEHRETKSTV